MEIHGAPMKCSITLAGRSISRHQTFLTVAFAFLVAASVCLPAYGDVGVILNESLNTGFPSITGTGHSAVYLSRVCAASAVRLRLCDPGEQGSVISTYSNFDENHTFKWNVVPLTVFLYGVDDPEKRPLFASPQIKHLLEEQYREKFLSAYCADPPCSTDEKANWRDMVGATFDRNIYIFAVTTTIQQDEDLIAKFNALPNDGHFNMISQNCADFTREVINAYFPHATHRDYINDFGITSPKAVAHSFVRYALRHPDAQLRVLHFSQLPGTIKRSSEVRDGTEQIFHSKKWLVPMLLFASHELPVFPISYFLFGRFNPQHELEEHPTAQATALGYQIQIAESNEDDERVEQLTAAKNRERANVVGSAEQWKQYRGAFALIVDEGIREEVLPGRDSLNHVFKQIDQMGRPVFDEHGTLWMQVQDGSVTTKVGLSPDNILAPGSDSHLALELLFGRIDQALKSSPHSRETMPEFARDWALMQRAQEKISILAQEHAQSLN